MIFSAETVNLPPHNIILSNLIWYCKHFWKKNKNKKILWYPDKGLHIISDPYWLINNYDH